MTSPSDKFPATHFCISFGRSKEWYFWLLKSREEAPDHFQNFRISARAVEERLSKENTPLNDSKLLYEIVQELIQSQKYFAVTFPVAYIGLDYFNSKTKRIFKYYPEFPVLAGQDNIHPDHILFYTLNLIYLDEFKLSLFKANPKLPSLIESISRKIIKQNLDEDINFSFLHDAILSELKEKGFEEIDVYSMLFDGLSHRDRLCYEWWGDFLSKEFLDLHQENTDPNVGTGTDVWPF